MTEADAKTKMCPIIGIQVAILGSAIIGAAAKMNNISGLTSLLEKDDKNCIGSRCMMWNRKRKDCGLKS